MAIAVSIVFSHKEHRPVVAFFGKRFKQLKCFVCFTFQIKSFCFLHLSIILDGRDRHEALDHIQFAVDKVIIQITPEGMLKVVRQMNPEQRREFTRLLFA